jgi:hypothetical protein
LVADDTESGVPVTAPVAELIDKPEDRVGEIA